MNMELGSEETFPIAYIDKEYVDLLAKQQSISNYINTASKIYVDTEKNCFSVESFKEKGKLFAEFVEIVYEYLPKLAIDSEKGVTITKFAIYLPKSRQLLYVNAGTRVFIVEAFGRSVYPLVLEGEKVSEHDKIFYIVTNKFEIRAVRAEAKGIVVYVGDVLDQSENKMMAVIVGEENVIRFSRCD